MKTLKCPTCGHEETPLGPKSERRLKWQLGQPARELRHAKKYLRELTRAVTQALAALDAEMKKPSTNERGQRIAKISNFLELQNDLAKRFGL